LKNSATSSFLSSTFTTSRHFGLDLIRALAIALVLVNHGAFFFSSLYPVTFSFAGIVGVELFFILSGYLIGTILLRQHFASTGFAWRHLPMFWKRRWFRTLPAYFIILSICVLVYHDTLWSEHIDIFPYFLFLQNWNGAISPFFMESWSLSVEEWFYIGLPLGLLLLSFLSKKWSAKGISAVLFLFILIATFYRWWFASHYHIPDWNLHIRQVVVVRLDATAYGVLLAAVHRGWVVRLKKQKGKLFSLGAVGVVLSTTLYAFAPHTTLFHAFFPTLLSASLLLLFPLVLFWQTSSNGWVKKGITHLSQVSYSIYLINYSLVLLPMSTFFLPANLLWALVLTVVFWTISLIFASLFYAYVEKPITDLRDK
jgi:peptidoglycan/LPS O-acetylase OafA/YrhL